MLFYQLKKRSSTNRALDSPCPIRRVTGLVDFTTLVSEHDPDILTELSQQVLFKFRWTGTTGDVPL